MHFLKRWLDWLLSLIGLQRSSTTQGGTTSSYSTRSSTKPDFPEMKAERTQLWPESPEDARGEEQHASDQQPKSKGV